MSMYDNFAHVKSTVRTTGDFHEQGEADWASGEHNMFINLFCLLNLGIVSENVLPQKDSPVLNLDFHVQGWL